MMMRQWLCLLLLFILIDAQAQLPVSGLVAHYPFNNSAADESGNKNDGVLNGAIAPATDRFGNPCGALRFIGTGCYISVPNSTILKAPVNSLSICAWVKPERGINSNGEINLLILAKPGIETGNDIAPQYCFQLKRAFGDSYSTITLSNDFTFQDKQYNSHPIEFGKWYFIAVTYEEDFVQVYQDGKLIAQAPKLKHFQPNDFTLEVGRDIVAGKRYFNGCMDDLRIYNRGLNVAEVNVLYKDETGKEVKGDVAMNFPKSIEKKTDPGKCSATVFYTEPTAAMGCGSVVLKQTAGQPSGSAFAVGKNKLVYAATVGDRLLTDSFDITVTDNEPPVYRCLADINRYAEASGNGAVVNYAALAVSDNCPNVKSERVEGLASGAMFPTGVTVVKYKATDAVGNTAECSFKVTVSARETETPVVAKPVAEPVVKKTEPVAKPADKIVTAPVQKTEPVKAKDTAPVVPKPVKNLYINCPADVAPKAERGKCGAIVNYPAPQVPLGSGIVVVQTKGQRSGTLFTCGVTTNTFTVNDGAGTYKADSFTITIKDNEAPAFACPKDTVILLAPGRKGLVYHYIPPHATDNCAVDSIEMVAGPKNGCFLQLGVHPFVFRAYDKAGNVQTCTYSVMVKEDASLAHYEPPIKLDAHLALGSDSVHYEHNASVNSCDLTLLIYDDGEEDNDSVTIILNDEVIVNRDMIRVKDNGAFKRTVSLIPGQQNYLIAKAWNTGRYGLNTLRIDVFEGTSANDKKDTKLLKPAMSKVLHSKPGSAGGILLKCQ